MAVQDCCGNAIHVTGDTAEPEYIEPTYNELRYCAYRGVVV